VASASRTAALTLPSLAETRDTAPLDRTIQAVAKVPDVAGLPLLVVASNCQVDQRFLDVVSRLKPSVILAETHAAGQTLSSLAGTIVSVDAGAFGGGPGPDDSRTQLQYLARMRAESFLAAMNPAEGNVRVIASELEASLDSVANPWENRVSLAGLNAASSPWSSTVAAGSPATGQEQLPGRRHRGRLGAHIRIHQPCGRLGRGRHAQRPVPSRSSCPPHGRTTTRPGRTSLQHSPRTR